MAKTPLKGIDRTVIVRLDKTGAVHLTITEGDPEHKETATLLLTGTIRTSDMNVLAMIIASALSEPERDEFGGLLT